MSGKTYERSGLGASRGGSEISEDEFDLGIGFPVNRKKTAATSFVAAVSI